ncbi:hypothetical protein ACRALDRAFT_2018492 [Sodiomyces alcalophilus JCM 7366]|uniref:uncharacterized protein n=1 Tax=Sodiomyces alcalophilus JCM 7366 TaxID=591952 RepID=UPI0039B5AB8E
MPIGTGQILPPTPRLSAQRPHQVVLFLAFICFSDFVHLPMAQNGSTSSDEAVIEKHGDEIIRVCSYHRRDFDLVVIRSRPHEMQPVLASITTASKTKPQARFSWLASLPPELMSMVILQLDVRSVFRFRQVNSLARSIITDIREYRLVAKHGLEGLRGLLRAGLAQCHLLRDLYRALLEQSCASCGLFGCLLFLFTLERCCFSCLQSSERYHVIAQSTFSSLAKISRTRLSRFPGLSLRTVPGIYHMLEVPARRPKYLVSEFKATPVLLASDMIGDDTARKLKLRQGQSAHRFMAATAFPYYSLDSAKVDHGVSCKGCQIRFDRLRDDPTDRDRCFSQEGFLTHFPECLEALQLWTESREGTCPVDEPEFTRRCGYFKLLGPDGLPA